MNHSVSHLKVFGCVTYAHVLDELRKKLDKKGKNVFFLAIMKTQKHTSCMTISQGKQSSVATLNSSRMNHGMEPLRRLSRLC